MTASCGPRMTPPRCPEGSFSSWRSAGILLVAIVLQLPSSTDACDAPPRFDSMKLKGDSAPPYKPGDRAEYECRPGYKRIVPPLPTSSECQPDNTWTPLQEACTRKECPHPAEFKNGQINGSYEFGSRIQYTCNEGYFLIGSKILYCDLIGDKLSWSDDPPICERILCQPPRPIENGKYTDSHKESFEYHDVVTYSCNPSNGPDEYSLVGEKKLICSGQNIWSSDPPVCKVVKCPFPTLKDGKLVSGFGKKFYYEAKVVLECQEGFYLEGSSTIVCGANSTWVPEVPKCIPVFIPPTSTPPPILTHSVSTRSTQSPITTVSGVTPVHPTTPTVPSQPDPSTPTDGSSPGKLDGGAIAGIVLGILLPCLAIVTIILYCQKKKKKGKTDVIAAYSPCQYK